MNAHAFPATLAGKKIVVLIGHFGRGGCERQAYLFARESRSRYGLDVQVWALSGDDHNAAYAMEFQAAGIPIHVLSGFRRPMHSIFNPIFAANWTYVSHRIARQLRKGRIDALLPFTTWPNVVAGLSYRLAGIPLCIWGERHCGGERVPVVEHLAASQYRRFVANSTAGVEFLAREMRIPHERLSFVPNGVEDVAVDGTTDWRARLRLKPDEPLVLKIANITRYKDHLTLLQAWKIVQETWSGEPRPFLALAGACHFDDLYYDCLRVVREAGMESSVRFLESIPDVPSLLQASDLTVFSSRNEGMPNGVLECMNAGKAIVASDLPGIRDALGSQAEGVVVPPGDSAALAKLLLDLLRDKRKRVKLGEENRKRIQTDLSVGRMAERHLQIIADELTRASRQKIIRRADAAARQETCEF
ncbi:MAG TPA: glycosyltransferase [Micropepsaceae bacterium]|nr:glycosyltransferase [Micropepsaceae bacterium]